MSVFFAVGFCFGYIGYMKSLFASGFPTSEGSVFFLKRMSSFGHLIPCDILCGEATRFNLVLLLI